MKYESFWLIMTSELSIVSVFSLHRGSMTAIYRVPSSNDVNKHGLNITRSSDFRIMYMDKPW